MAQEAPPATDPAPAEPTDAEPPEKAEPQDGKTFDEAYVKQLRSEAAQYRTRAQEAEGKLSEREEADKSEVEKAQGKATKAEERAREAEAKLMRYEVAKDKEVPAAAVDFLQGNTREELEASADRLLELVKKESGTTPDFDGGAREPAPDPKSPEDQHTDTLLEVLGIKRT